MTLGFRTRFLMQIFSMTCCVMMVLPVSAQILLSAGQKKSKNEITVLRVYYQNTDQTETSVSPGLMQQMAGVASSMLSSHPPGSYRVGSLMTAFYTFAGKTPSRPESVKVTFTAIGGNKYKSNRDYTVKADGEIVIKGTADYRQRQLETGRKADKELGIEEALTLIIPIDIFIRVASAKKVQVKLGPTDFDLSEKQRKSLSALAASIDKCERPDCLWGTFDQR